MSSKMMPMRRTIKNVVKNYSSVEVKVREATSNDPWGPSSTMMSEISELTYQPMAIGQIMAQIWKRLNDHGKNWRHVYKALVLVEYIIRSGSEQVTVQCKQNIYAIQTLKDFQYVEDGKDHGLNVREKAKQLVSLLRDDEKLRNEREKAAKARERINLGGAGSAASRSTLNIFAMASNGSQKRNGYEESEPAAKGESTVVRQQIAATGANARASQIAFPTSRRRSMVDLRPTDATEEDLQLQLALQLSKQEHDKAQQQAKQDQIKLQMALEVSRKEVVPAAASEDLLGLSLDTSTSTNPVRPQTVQQDTLADLGDPWAVPTSAWGPPPATAPASIDPFASNAQFDPFANSSKPQLPRSQSDNVVTPLAPKVGTWKMFEFEEEHEVDSAMQQADPFSVKLPAATATAEQDLPEFDVFAYRSDSAKQPPPARATTWDAFGQSDSVAVGDARGDLGFSFDSEPQNEPSSSDPFGLVELTAQQVEAAKRKQKTPQEFLGDNAKLVDLEALVARPPPGVTNPFTTLAPSGAQQFQATPNKISIAQLMQQKQSGSVPPAAAAAASGSLPAPLIALPPAGASSTLAFGAPTTNAFGAASAWPAQPSIGLQMQMQMPMVSNMQAPFQPQQAFNPFS